ncbi:tyrosine-type recombinase/integrase [Minwuia thermotolerans]|uniref:Recombinase XerC n=1 Tax=Minwuia thermotolerans TaxID=2056226 RepID=A0A2M9G6J3_9PROT|nr:site-specific integrase [Minwuia thermotolerans]PJK31339.1 recombinase XerC [Minwuia thermotolerans]
MRKHHPENERIKRRYLTYLREAKRLSETSVDQAAAAIAAFEASTGFRDFKRFHIEQARKFKRDLVEQINPATGKPLAKATVHARLMALKAFVQWLADQPGYRSRIRYSDADYFNPSANDSRIARAVRERPVPTVEQIRHVLATMSADTDIQRRDRALVAFTLLSGARDNAIASMSLKHVDVARRLVHQDAREVRTKRAKTFSSSFFPVGDDIEAIVTDWIDHLRTVLLFGDDDPLFPATRVAPNGDGVFAPAGLDRRHWKNAGAIRRIFREAFEAASLPYFNPHSFRNTLARLGEQVCRTPEEFKAWSQNFGHEKVLTTFTSYGAVAPHRQAEIMRSVRLPSSDREDELVRRIAEAVRTSR